MLVALEVRRQPPSVLAPLESRLNIQSLALTLACVIRESTLTWHMDKSRQILAKRVCSPSSTVGVLVTFVTQSYQPNQTPVNCWEWSPSMA